MNWTRSLMLLMGAWVLVGVSGCPADPEEISPGTCDELYGPPEDPQIEGYQLCEQTESSCVFYRTDTVNAAISCGAICAFESAACLAAYNPVEDVCDLANRISCADAVNTAVCECGAAIEGVNNRIHIINGSNVPGITVTVIDASDTSYDAGELATADICCTGPNFLIEAGIGESLVIEAQWTGSTASKTCVVTPEADSPVGTNLQTFVNVFAEGLPAELLIVCDLGLAEGNGGTGGSGGSGGTGGSGGAG